VVLKKATTSALCLTDNSTFRFPVTGLPKTFFNGVIALSCARRQWPRIRITACGRKYPFVFFNRRAKPKRATNPQKAPSA